MSDYNKALADYKDAIILYPKHSDAILKCGIIYGKMNDKNRACEYFRLACALGEQEGCKINKHLDIFLSSFFQIFN